MWLAAHARELILAEASARAPLETGGVLLGWDGSPEHAGLVLARMLGPGPGATHRATRFSPDTRWQRRAIAELYEQSGRMLRYLGDWHSHPGGAGAPSARDLRTARRIARHRSARVRAPLMLILAGAEREWELCPHRLIDGQLEPLECRLASGLPLEADR